MDNFSGNDQNILIKDLFELMCEILAGRDYTTYEHAISVAALSVQIGSALQLSEEELKILELAGLVHDIGKTAIPDDILLKPDIFNEQDRKIMRYHPLIGARLFARRFKDDMIMKSILQHHERLDGSGYPHGLVGDEIDTLSNITAVADVFEALTAKRPYKKKVNTQSAFDILKGEVTANRLHKDVVAALLSFGDTYLPPKATDLLPISDFMKEIEHFRRDTFFKDTLSDLYNYRHLLVLDDAGVLREIGDIGFKLLLITFRDMSRFQQEYGFIIANQVHEEIGQRLKETVAIFKKERLTYEGSIMLFRKHCEYLIYAEGCSEKELSYFFSQVKGEIELLRDEWGLEANCFRLWFDRQVSIEDAMSQLFRLEFDTDKGCRTEE